MKTRLLVSLGLCAAALLAYAGSLDGGFTLDNKPLILEDPRLREASPENIGLIFQHTYWWPHGEAGLYRPLTTLSYLFNYSILGDQDRPEGYHWLNLLLHASNVLLVYLLAARLLRDVWPPFFVALVWAVHPVLTESVTNIVGRADLLSAAALLTGLLLYAASAEAKGGRRIALLAGVMAATAAGVFAKESAVVLPALFVLFEAVATSGRVRARALAAGCAATLLPIAAMLLIRAHVLASSPPAVFPFLDNPLVGAGFWSGKVTAIEVMGRYLLLLLWPARLSTDYSYAQVPPASGTAADWLALVAAAAALAGAALLYTRNRTAFFWMGFAFLTFLPVSNLLFPIGTIMAERFLYLPSLGFVACAVMSLYAIAGRTRLPRLAPALLSLAALAGAARTWARNADWHDDVTLARSAVAASPRSFKTHKTLAAALLAADPGHANIDAVIKQAAASVALLEGVPDRDSDAAAYRLAGAAYLLKNDRAADQRALPVLLRCVRIADAQPGAQHPNPNDDAHRLLAIDYLRLGEQRQALAEARMARERDPLNPEAYRQLAAALAANAQPDEAAVTLMEGVFLTSDQSLRQEVLRLYREGLDPKGCATVNGPNGPAINPACQSVHRHLCRAAAEAIRVSLQIGRQDIAGPLEQGAIAQLACTQGE